MKNFYFFLVIFLTITASCSKSETEYWWTRGQPPAPSTLSKKMQDRLQKAQENSAIDKNPILNISRNISTTLATVSNELSENSQSTSIKEKLNNVGHKFLELEGKLTYTSRPAYGELSGQLRTFIEKTEDKEQLSKDSFDLFVARTCSFLADELEVVAKL